MKRALFLCFAALSLASCSSFGVRHKLSELNHALRHSEQYMQAFNVHADSIRSALKAPAPDSVKWDSCYELFATFINICQDSALHYCNELAAYTTSADLSQRTLACRLNVMHLMDENDSIKALVPYVDASQVSQSFLSEYYYYLQRSFKAVDDSMNVAVMAEASSCPRVSAEMRARMKGLLLFRNRDVRGALEQFRLSYDRASSYRVKALAAYKISRCYKALNDDENCVYWLAEAAINDIKTPCKFCSSLPELSLELVKMNWFHLASRYMNISMQYAIQGHWRNLVNKYAPDQIVIAEALSHSSRVMTVFLTLLGLSVLVICVMYFDLLQQRRRLRRTNDIMLQMNDKLKDEGKIREAYLFSYMVLAVEYLGYVETYRHDMRKALKEGGLESIQTMLRGQGRHDAYKEFYEKFDRTFLEIFPDFVSKVNMLLSEDSRLDGTIPFSTNLRILATIRLGFKEPRQIAAFLNVPVTSVYSRRSDLKRACVCNKEEFEEKIREIW